MNKVGVCSWSLRPSTPGQLAVMLSTVGVDCVQLALDPLRVGVWDFDHTVEVLAEAGISARSGMMQTIGEDYSTLDTIRRTGGVRLDEHWEANRDMATEIARIARRLELPLVSFHAGFLPEEPDSVERATMLERLREIVDRFAEEGIAAAFETGQESAETLLAVLDELDRAGAGVNFDPANLILYDKDEPVDALRRLVPWVRQIHVKDAVRTRTPGTWGDEVPAGDGEVDWDAFFRILHEEDVDCDLMIEREAGENRIGDIQRARELVTRQLSQSSSEQGAPH